MTDEQIDLVDDLLSTNPSTVNHEPIVISPLIFEVLVTTRN